MNIQTYKNTAYTYSLVNNGKGKGAIVILDGVPSVPGKKDGLMASLSNCGYDVFFPRYEGTWESGGVFLERNPVDVAAEFIDKLISGIMLDGVEYRASSVFLLGASFGGGVALSLSDRSEVDKICAVSPVLSFRKVSGIETLEGYLRASLSSWYRFTSEAWRSLLDDKMYCPFEKTVVDPKKVFVFAGEHDPEISVDDVRFYCEKNRLLLRVEPVGHITLSKISEEAITKIDEFFSNK